MDECLYDSVSPISLPLIGKLLVLAVDTPVLKESPLTSSSLPTPAQSAADVECPLLPAVGSLLPPPLSPSAALSVPSADPAPVVLLDTPSPAPSPYSGEPEEEKAKKLLYCSLCKVAVNSLSQLEAHNKGESFMQHLHQMNTQTLEFGRKLEQCGCFGCR